MDSHEFLEFYSPAHQYEYALYEKRCHQGTAPNIMQCVARVGIETTAKAIDALIMDFIAYTPARHRSINNEQRRQLVFVIITQFKTLKITQLILFIVKAKAGVFGKFYNNIEPMDITIALQQWNVICDREITEYYSHRAREMSEGDLDRTREMEEELRAKYDEIIALNIHRLKI